MVSRGALQRHQTHLQCQRGRCWILGQPYRSSPPPAALLTACDSTTARQLVSEAVAFRHACGQQGGPRDEQGA